MTYNSKRNEDISNTISNMNNSLTAIARNTVPFQTLKNLLPLMGEVKTAENLNKQMGELLRILQDALSKAKTSYGFTNKKGESLGNVLDRMSNQLHNQFVKIKEQAKNAQGNYNDMEMYKNRQLQEQTCKSISEIQLIINQHKQKLLAYVERKRKELLPNSTELTKYFKKQVNTQLTSSTITTDLQTCRQVLGQIKCQHQRLKKKQQDHDIQTQLTSSRQDSQSRKSNVDVESVIVNFDGRVMRQFKFVIDNLNTLTKLQHHSLYNQRQFYFYFSWATRIRTSLQSIIIKMIQLQRQYVDRPEQAALLSRVRRTQSNCTYMIEQLSPYLTLKVSN